MTATTGSDPSGPVQYYFDENNRQPGRNRFRLDYKPDLQRYGIKPNTQYTYRVQMRDCDSNTGSWSTSQSATTPAAVPTYVALVLSHPVLEQ